MLVVKNDVLADNVDLSDQTTHLVRLCLVDVKNVVTDGMRILNVPEGDPLVVFRVRKQRRNKLIFDALRHEGLFMSIRVKNELIKLLHVG